MRVFVYGTLKATLDNSHLLRTAKFLGEAYTVDTFRMYSVGFPIIRFCDDGQSVFGEVYEIDEQTLKRLDILESEGHMYDRKKISIVYVNGIDRDLIEHDVYVYVGNDEYWNKKSSSPYTYANDHGELDWRLGVD